MKINLLKGSFTYGAVTILSRVATIFLIPILTRILSPEEYGLLNMVITIVALANLFVTFEIAQAVTLYFNDLKRNNRDLYPSTAFVFSMTMYFFLLVFVFIFGNMILKMYNIEDSIGISILFYGAMLLSVNGIFFFIQNQLRLEFLTRKFATLTIGFVLLTSIGSLGGAILFKNKIEGVISGQVLGAAIIDVIGIVIFWEQFSKGFNAEKLKEMLKFSLPLVPSGLLMLGGQQIPKLILSKYGSLEDVGIFGLATQIAGFAGITVLGVQTAITPSILANHHIEETPKMLGKLFEKFAIIALIFCAFLSAFANELVVLFSAPSYSGAANFVPYLAFAIVLNSLYIFFPGKIINGKSIAQLLASGGSFLVAVVAGYFLVNFDGIRGAAVSSLLAAITFLSIWCYISQKLYKIPVNWYKIFKLTVFTIILCFVCIYLISFKISLVFLLSKGLILVVFVYIIAREHLLDAYNQFILKKLKKNN